MKPAKSKRHAYCNAKQQFGIAHVSKVGNKQWTVSHSHVDFRGNWITQFRMNPKHWNPYCH